MYILSSHPLSHISRSYLYKYVYMCTVNSLNTGEETLKCATLRKFGVNDTQGTLETVILILGPIFPGRAAQVCCSETLRVHDTFSQFTTTSSTRANPPIRTAMPLSGACSSAVRCGMICGMMCLPLTPASDLIKQGQQVKDAHAVAARPRLLLAGKESFRLFGSPLSNYCRAFVNDSSVWMTR